MHIVISATATQQEYLTPMLSASGLEISWIKPGMNPPEADGYFDFCFEEEGYAFDRIHSKPVFVNAVIQTTASLPPHCIRFNGWRGFMQKNTFEIAAGNPEMLSLSTGLRKKMNWKWVVAPDEPGLLGARVLAMIINEAYFGSGESISTKKDIDTAMKLGTNYPYGPFEWSEMIGLDKINRLLCKMSESSARYSVAPLLSKEAALNNQQH